MNRLDSLHSRVLRLKQQFDDSLILNPTENIPWTVDADISFVEGMYFFDNTDIDSRVLFSGRDDYANLVNEYSLCWTNLIHAEKSCFKLYSGLHAHTIVFMALAKVGDKVLLMPTEGGGHSSTWHILTRLGLWVKEFVVDCEKMQVDVIKSGQLIEEWKPDYVFVDRSDGLTYEDFSWLNDYKAPYKIFDASQYLVHILAGHYQNPFYMGFDMILTSLHKNYPGPQQAALFSKESSEQWDMIQKGIELFVSNPHPLEICKALFAFPNVETLIQYSHTMLDNTQRLESALRDQRITVVNRDWQIPHTQQIWIQLKDKHTAFRAFKRLEANHYLTNYRVLPYRLGYGLRLGTAAATRQGLTSKHMVELGASLANIINTDKISMPMKNYSLRVIKSIKNIPNESESLL